MLAREYIDAIATATDSVIVSALCDDWIEHYEEIAMLLKQIEVSEQITAQQKLFPLPPVSERYLTGIIREAEAIRSRLSVLECMAVEMAQELEAAKRYIRRTHGKQPVKQET